MCGIGAILRITPAGQRHEPIPEAWLNALDGGIAWRGPDGAGRFRDQLTREDGSIVEVAMVHRRLAIIDIEGGAQPMVLELHDCPACAAKLAERRRNSRRTSDRANEPSSHRGWRETSGGRIAVVFNGCIYNHRELREELEAAGHVFRTDHSDTEVILHGHSEWRDELSARLEGMFAIGLWCSTEGEVRVYRDRFGEKPLYTGMDAQEQAFGFSSVAMSLTGEPFDASQCDQDQLALWLPRGWAKEPPLISVQSLAPGSWRTLGQSDSSASTIARVPQLGKHDVLDEREIERRIEASVAARLESDVPIGCFLSGGIDSSLIALMVSRHAPEPVTLSVRMPDERYDETRHAQMVSRHLGTRHITLDCDGVSATDDLVRLIQAMGLPFGDSSILPTYWLCREARKHVKVALAGDGGDELFLGYDRFRAIPLLRRWGWLLRLAPLSLWNTSDRRSLSSRAYRLCEAAHGQGFLELETIFPFVSRRRLLADPRHWELASPWGSTSSMDWARRLAMVSYLPCDLLVKVDTASMFAGVEVRCPLLAPSVADAALRLSTRDHMRRGESKHILKQIARKHLPPEIIDRPKQGFAIPISEWWRTDFGGLGSLMLERLSKDQPFGAVHEALEINMPFVRQMIDEHWAAGGLAPRFSTRAVRPRDHGQRLFALVALSIWSDSLT